MNRSSRWATSLASISCLTACDMQPVPPSCQPDRAELEADILPRVETFRGNCHGAEPNFGAPLLRCSTTTSSWRAG